MKEARSEKRYIKNMKTYSSCRLLITCIGGDSLRSFSRYYFVFEFDLLISLHNKGTALGLSSRHPKTRASIAPFLRTSSFLCARES